jgi:hypothetical protein
MPEMFESELMIAARHVAEGRQIVAKQRERVARLKAVGASTFDHEHTLRIFESTLLIFEEHERSLRCRLPPQVGTDSSSF